MSDYFFFSLHSSKHNAKFNFLKLDYVVRFEGLEQVTSLPRLSRILAESFTRLIDDARSHTDDDGLADYHMQVSLLHDAFPGGEVELPFVSLRRDGF